MRSGSSRRKEALISVKFEPRYLGCYEVLESAPGKQLPIDRDGGLTGTSYAPFYS